MFSQKYIPEYENLSENTENFLCSQKLVSAIFKASSLGPQA